MHDYWSYHRAQCSAPALCICFPVLSHTKVQTTSLKLRDRNDIHSATAAETGDVPELSKSIGEQVQSKLAQNLLEHRPCCNASEYLRPCCRKCMGHCTHEQEL